MKRPTIKDYEKATSALLLVCSELDNPKVMKNEEKMLELIEMERFCYEICHFVRMNLKD